MSVRRGEIWLIDLGEPIGREQSGRRPVVVVSDDEVNGLFAIERGEGLAGVIR